MYVALTRAKTYLFLYSVKELFQKEAKVSRYIGEIRSDPELYREGDRVCHRNFGPGTVLGAGDGKVRIKFDNHRKIRTFSVAYLSQEGLLTAYEEKQVSQT